MGGRRQVHGINNWFIATSSLGLIAQRQIVLATPDKDQEALLCKLVLELCPITIPGSSYKRQSMADSWQFTLLAAKRKNTLCTLIL